MVQYIVLEKGQAAACHDEFIRRSAAVGARVPQTWIDRLALSLRMPHVNDIEYWCCEVRQLRHGHKFWGTGCAQRGIVTARHDEFCP